MRTTYIYMLWLCLGSLFGIPLSAQNNTCGPEAVIEDDEYAGTAFFNYGGTTRSKSNVYRTALAIGQNFVGYTDNVTHSTGIGFYSRYFLPPFALKVKASQGELLDRIQVTWEIDALGPSPNEGFNIYRDGIFLAAVGANIRSYNDFNVIAGRPYTYTVRGLNIYGEGAPSDALGFQVPNGVVTGWISTINGTPVADATVTLTPMQGFSARFLDGDGALAIADTLNPFLPDQDEDWTITFWIKTDTAGSNSGKLIGMPGLVIRSRPTTNGINGIAVATTPGGGALLVANFADHQNDWHHVALTYDKNGNKGRLYLDGKLMDLDTLPELTSPDEINFGERIASGLWEGRIDELRIYHRRLDELDFDMVMEGTASSTTPFLSYYWKMDEQLGERSYDIIHRHPLYFCGSAFDADRPPVHVAGMTNEDGFYSIESASYGTGTTFLAKPKKNFYMHRSLKFERAEQDYATLPDFPMTKKATIEMWVNSAGVDGFQCLLAKKWGANNEFRIVLAPNGTQNEIRAVLNENVRTFGNLGSDYQHLAFTWDSTARTMKLYKNGVQLGAPATWPLNVVNTGNWSDPDPSKTWVLGKRNDNTLFYGGLIDEVAFYDTTLSVQTIQNHADTTRDIQERGLRVFFPLDEGSGNRLNNVGSLLLTGGTTLGTEWSPLATHQVIEPHVFTPSTRQVTLNPSVTSVDQVDFVDRSTITVTGYVRFKNTDCFAKKVEILINGQSFGPPVLTDSTGKFTIDFDPGTTAILTPVFEDHVFTPAFWEVVNVSSPIAGILFNDMTTRSITGKVAGGECEKSIITAPAGQNGGTFCYVRVSSADQCYEKEILIDNQAGEFEFHDLPPLEKMNIAVTGHDDPDIDKAFEDQGGIVLDLSRQDTMINFIYTAPPQIEYTSLELAPFDPPFCNTMVLDQDQFVTVEFNLYEQYTPIMNGNTVVDDGVCELDTASFRIINGFSDEVKDTTMSQGLVTYEFQAGVPNPSYPYLKTMQVIATTLKGVETSLTLQALITGIRAKENTFSSTLPETPGLILRDPPGDGSYSFLEANEKFCQKTAFTTDTEVGLGESLTLILGGENEAVVAPLGIGSEFDWEYQNDIGVEAKVTYQQISEDTYETCTSFSSTISTSAEELIVGGERGGDLYMGTALNIIYGNVDIVYFDEENCVGIDSTAIQVQPGDFATTFIYSEFFILGTLIPGLERLITESQATPEQVLRYQESIDRWLAIVEDNRVQKENARFIRNISFDAGTEFEYTETSDTTSTEAFEEKVKGEFSLGATIGFTLIGIGIEFKFKATTVTSGGQRNEAMVASGITSGYKLADNDPLDAFTFDVGMDSTYKTPVFDLKAGQSSCPWEPGTANREAPNLELATGFNFTAINVPANEPAVFKLLLGNLSATNEDWTYGFTSVATSNPDGAIIKLNGQPLNYVQQYIVPYGTTREVTLTVERGPIEYEYDDLLVAQISTCEWERNHALSIPVDADEKFFSGINLSVHFIRPCSEVNIHDPEQNWVIFPGGQPPTPNVLKITSSRYDLLEPNFKLIRMQFRPSDGNGTWLNIDGVNEIYNPNWIGFGNNPPPMGIDTLKPVFTNFFWDTEGYADGDYEIRALTVCENAIPNNNGYSEIIKGRIDREAPSLVGVPQPSDGVLHVGDEISFTFNQPVNCDKLIPADMENNNNVGLYDATTDELLIFEFSCVDNKIVLNPLEPNDEFENHILRAEIDSIEDLTGNIFLGGPPMYEGKWEFYVDRNELAWLTDSAGITKYEDETKSVTVKIHNRGGYPVPFEIQDAPEWVHVTPDAGTLVANEIREIQFTAADTLDVQWFKDSVHLYTVSGQNPFFMGGTESLPFDVRNVCRPPDWVVDPGLYQQTMTLVTRVKIDPTPPYDNFIFSADPEDQVGAFIDGQLRGSAKLSYVPPPTNQWMAFVTIYGNTGDLNKLVTLEIFDASACLHYPAEFGAGGTFNFTPNGNQGAPSAPRILQNYGLLLNDIEVNKGWNWISFNLGFPDPSINQALDNIPNPNGDLIKDQTQFATYNNNTWSGSLSTVGNTSMYMYQAAQPNTIKIIGTALTPASTPIPVGEGWNWIGYIPTYKLTVNAALASLPAQTGDIIKSQTAFAQYVNSNVGWIGDLKKLEPLHGYLLRLDTSGTLTYPAQPFTGDDPFYSRDAETLSTYWNVDASKYENNMTLIGIFEYDEINATTSDMELGAFVGDEIRGAGQAVYIEYLDAYVFYLTCFANTSGEQLHFKLLDGFTGEVQNLAEKLVFLPNSHNGSITEPVPFTLQITGMEDLTSELSFNVQPNPFRDETVCRIELPEAQEVRLIVTDMDGRMVDYMTIPANAGMNTYTWKARNTSGRLLYNGVYYMRMETTQGVLTKKVVVQR